MLGVRKQKLTAHKDARVDLSIDAMGRPKLQLSDAERIERRRAQNRSAIIKWRSKNVQKTREIQTTQRWTYRQRHPESAEKEREKKRNHRARIKMEEKAAKIKEQSVAIRVQAIEPKTKKFIKRCFKC